MNAGDVAEFPWLGQAAELVRLFTAAEKPVLTTTAENSFLPAIDAQERAFIVPIRKCFWKYRRV